MCDHLDLTCPETKYPWNTGVLYHALPHPSIPSSAKELHLAMMEEEWWEASYRKSGFCSEVPPRSQEGVSDRVLVLVGDRALD